MAAPVRKSMAFAPPAPEKKPRHKRGGKLLADDMETLAELRAEKERTAALAKDAKEQHDDFERYVLDRMLFERMPAVPAEGRTFYQLHTPKAIVEDIDGFVAWARENDPDLLKEQPGIREGDLNTLVKRCLADGTDLPPHVGYWIKSSIGHRSTPA